MDAQVVIPADLAAFFESGVTLLVGTRDASMVPECMRGIGARVAPDARRITIFLPAATAAATLTNLGENGRIAVCFTRVFDHRSIQVKGRVVALRPADTADRRVIDSYRSALCESLGWVGVPNRLVLRIAHWPCQAVEFEVESVFVQTPGPGAGAVLGLLPEAGRQQA